MKTMIRRPAKRFSFTFVENTWVVALVIGLMAVAYADIGYAANDCHVKAIGDCGPKGADAATALAASAVPAIAGPEQPTANVSLALAATPLPPSLADATNGPPAPRPATLADNVKATISSYMGHVKFCFAQKPDAAGVATVQFVAHPEGGVVTDVRLTQSTLGSAEVEGCLLRHVAVMELPSFEGTDKKITVPFHVKQ